MDNEKELKLKLDEKIKEILKYISNFFKKSQIYETKYTNDLDIEFSCRPFKNIGLEVYIGYCFKKREYLESSYFKVKIAGLPIEKEKIFVFENSMEDLNKVQIKICEYIDCVLE